MSRSQTDYTRLLDPQLWRRTGTTYQLGRFLDRPTIDAIYASPTAKDELVALLRKLITRDRGKHDDQLSLTYVEHGGFGAPSHIVWFRDEDGGVFVPWSR
jgi:hypothetical protein